MMTEPDLEASSGVPSGLSSSIKTLLGSQLTNKRPVQLMSFVLFSFMVLLLINPSSTTSGYGVVRANEKRVETSVTLSSPKAGVGPCPPPDPAVDQRYIGFPQNLTFGKHVSEKGEPFLTQDFWADIVDNRRTFFLRSTEGHKPSAERLRDWVRSRPHPITLIINNQVDKSWPEYLRGKKKFEYYLNETNLHAAYAMNARHLPQYPKLQPIPIGLKWAWSSTKLFGEEKNKRADKYKRFGASSPEQSKALFHLTNRTSLVFLRPMNQGSNLRTINYVRNTPALTATRGEIPSIVNETAKQSIAFTPMKNMPLKSFFEELKKHRFVISPPGNGLDTHATWEALLCGCIPIVPHSPLDPVFEHLPVWLVDSWEDVTDASVKEKEEYFKKKANTYKWEKLYRSYWAERIYDGLCTV
ncbi:unnamed protein product [Cylindrotheca closterium]|uniref:Exostosin GT47 domain-containing protein n=1 Tax=Cylindrotheca closterium TaxID=2856 RepID=A0AAD2G3T4_9STRA|nr:unnamed protein product [Cylindrotheca closterium]